MISLVQYITEAKSKCPPELEKYEKMARWGELEDLKPKDFEYIYQVCMKIEAPKNWVIYKPVIQYIHDGDLDSLETLSHAFYNDWKGDKATQKEAKKIDKASDNIKLDSTVDELLIYSTSYFFNKLKPKKKLKDPYYLTLRSFWQNILYFSDYFTDNAKEAARKEKLAKLPSNMRPWYDKCVDFCSAGSWRYTDLKPKDFDPEFFEACKEFDFTKIKDLNSDGQKITPIITELVHALFSDDKEKVEEVFDKYEQARGPHPWWYQSDWVVSTSGGSSIAQAALLIGMSQYLKLGTNYWPDVTIDRIKEEIKKKK